MGGNRRMSARWHFGRGRKEANPNIVIAGAGRENKGSLRIVHFACNRLHLRCAQAVSLRHNTRRISSKQLGREGINLIQPECLHGVVVGHAGQAQRLG